MNGWQLLFGFRGRINRTTFWLMTLVFVMIYMAVLFTWFYYAGPGSTDWPWPSSLWIATGVVGVAVSVSIVATMVKRLHDRDRSGLWSTLYFGAPLALSSVAYFFDIRIENSADPANVPLLLGNVVIFASFVELGFMRGTAGPNRFGPAPDNAPWRSGRRGS